MPSEPKINCLIIDNDPFIQNLLSDKLKGYFPYLKIKGIASSGTEGIELIRNHNPDLIFLDVEMNDMSGFEMLNALDKIKFKTIFITSFNHYAIKAIRFNALDYLLKPFDLEELRTAINRYKKSVKIKGYGKNLTSAIHNTQSNTKENQILSLKTQMGMLQIMLKNILYIKGNGNYSNIHLNNERVELVSKTLRNLELLLDNKGFIRCHKSYLVNCFHIRSSRNKSHLTLSNDKVIPVSRRKFKALKNLLVQD